ncbi:MAG: MotA/TolQ/ExbB proton channel family protein, partial [Gammaproteobacteria bacterium]|nr:MotA/TolQ/ExbB proton channel family protein [Gammaproteobacteria bacterium]
MNDPLSVFALLASASWPVLLIMLGLVVASVVSWTMIVQRYLALSATYRDMTDFEDHFWSGKDIREIYKELEYADDLTGIEAIFVAGFGEYQRQMQISSSDTDAIINAIQRATRVAMTREELALEKHLGFLATLGSTAPYVGLFGTVIGIINSFRSLANMSQATLASVAPGI